MKKNKVYKTEIILVSILSILVVALPLINVYSSAIVTDTNFELEKIKSKIEKQANLNESLDMKISELTGFDKIQQIAEEYGLTYNNDNIKIIEKDKKWKENNQTFQLIKQ